MSKPFAEVAISAYNAICKVPQIAGGRFVSAPSFATIDFKQRCVPAGEFESYQLTANFATEKAENMCPIIGQPVPTGKNALFVSPSGDKQISLKTSVTDPKQQFFLYWNANRLEHTIDLKALDLHQQVVEKTPFHAVTWSPDERYFFYLAERKQSKTKSFFDQKPEPKLGDEIVPGNEYKYVEDWGEQLTGISKTVIGVFDSFTKAVSILGYDGGEDKCITKVLTSTVNSDHLYLIVHHVRPYRLGLVYCTQRRSDLVCLTGWQQQELKVTHVSQPDQELAIMDASISPDGKRVVWLQCLAGGPHNRAFEFWTAETDNLANSRRQVTSAKTCPLFFDTTCWVFLRNCWLNNRSLIVQTYRKSQSLIQIIDIDSSVIKDVAVPPMKTPLASLSLMDVSAEKHLLISESTLTSAPAILVGTPKGNDDLTFSFRRFAPFLVDDTYLESGITWSLQSTSYSNYECQYIVVSPKTPAKVPFPLIVIPHGGPHSSFITGFAEVAASLALSGFACILVNYPGSIGFDSVEALPGNIGILDLESVQHCVKDCLASNGNLNKDNVFMFGGSHGGFLALRLISAFPDFYRACACRNPVSDLAQMVGVSDIPDWLFVECGLQPSLTGFITMSDIANAEVLAKMNEQSPARFVSRIKCPLLMALGRNDRRVPMSQGMNFCRMLRQTSPQIPVEIFTYEDDHSLNSIKVHSDVFVNVALWFNKWLKK